MKVKIAFIDHVKGDYGYHSIDDLKYFLKIIFLEECKKNIGYSRKGLIDFGSLIAIKYPELIREDSVSFYSYSRYDIK